MAVRLREVCRERIMLAAKIFLFETNENPVNLKLRGTSICIKKHPLDSRGIFFEWIPTFI